MTNPILANNPYLTAYYEGEITTEDMEKILSVCDDPHEIRLIADAYSHAIKAEMGEQYDIACAEAKEKFEKVRLAPAKTKANPYYEKAVREGTPYEVIPTWCFQNPQDYKLIEDAFNRRRNEYLEDMCEWYSKQLGEIEGVK